MFVPRRSLSNLNHMTLLLACTGLMLPVEVLHAADSKPVARASQIGDISLGDNGRLSGRIVDSQGSAISDRVVVIQSNGQTIGRVKTDDNGRFRLTNLRGGVHQVVVGKSTTTHRLWANGTAPNQAQPQILLVADEHGVVRGAGPISNGVLVGGALAIGVIGGVIGYNVRDKEAKSP